MDEVIEEKRLCRKQRELRNILILRNEKLREEGKRLEELIEKLREEEKSSKLSLEKLRGNIIVFC